MRRAEASWREEQLELSGGTHGRGCAVIKPQQEPGGLRASVTKGIGGRLLLQPSTLQKHLFILSTASRAWGDSEGLCLPGLTASSLCMPWEVQDAAPLCWASSSPHPLLTHRRCHGGCAKPLCRHSCAGACRAPCPPPRRGDASQESKIASTPGAPAAGSAGIFRGAATRGGWRSGCCGGAFAVPAAFPGAAFPWAASALRTPQPVPAAGEAGWGSHVFGCPEGTGSVAGVASCPLLCHSTSAIPKLRAELAGSPVMGAEGMCSWRGGTHEEQWEHWI